MSDGLGIQAEVRSGQGKGAARRLRRQGRVPGIVYGGAAEPTMISVEHSVLEQRLGNEAFYSSLLDLDVGGESIKVVLKDLQRHPAKPLLLHVDFQRVSAGDKLRMTVPLHFENESTCEGVKSGGMVSHNVTEVEVTCLPADLPEFIAVDMAGMAIGDILHVSELTLPQGVELTHALDRETPVVMISAAPSAMAEAEDGGSDADGAGEGDTP